jgi:hypothetical protein
VYADPTRYGTGVPGVPAADPVVVSSLVIVDKAIDAQPDQESADNPLLVNRRWLIPATDLRISRRSPKETLFYFSAVPRAQQRLNARLQLMKGSEVVGETDLSMAPVRDGRIQQIGRLPTARLQTGSYRARIIVTDDASHMVEREIDFEVVD